MVSLLAWYNGVIFLNTTLLSAALIIVVPTAFHTRAPPGVEVIQFIYTLAVMIVSYGSLVYQSFLNGETHIKRAKRVYVIERVLSAQILACFLNSIAVTYRSTFLSVDAGTIIVPVLSWLATLFAGLGRFMLPRHPSIRLEAVTKFVVDNEPLDPDEFCPQHMELKDISGPFPMLPRVPEAARSKDSL